MWYTPCTVFPDYSSIAVLCDAVVLWGGQIILTSQCCRVWYCRAVGRFNYCYITECDAVVLWGSCIIIASQCCRVWYCRGVRLLYYYYITVLQGIWCRAIRLLYCYYITVLQSVILSCCEAVILLLHHSARECDTVVLWGSCIIITSQCNRVWCSLAMRQLYYYYITVQQSVMKSCYKAVILLLHHSAAGYMMKSCYKSV